MPDYISADSSKQDERHWGVQYPIVTLFCHGNHELQDSLSLFCCLGQRISSVYHMDNYVILSETRFRRDKRGEVDLNSLCKLSSFRSYQRPSCCPRGSIPQSRCLSVSTAEDTVFLREHTPSRPRKDRILHHRDKFPSLVRFCGHRDAPRIILGLLGLFAIFSTITVLVGYLKSEA